MNRGGTETWLMHVLRHIDRERYKIDFLTHTLQPGAYDKEIIALGSRIIPCLSPSKPWQYSHNFRRILRENGPYDIVHSHTYLFDALPMWLAAQRGVRGRISHIYPLADVQKQSLGRAFYRAVTTRLLSRYSTAILSDSQSSLDAFKQICECRHKLTRVVYCGIDLAPFNVEINKADVRHRLGIPVEKPLISYVARFVPHKNHAQLLRVSSLLNGEGSHFHFVVAGSHGPLLPQIRETIRDRDDISLLTGLSDISNLLLASDLFFFPSLEEGFGIVAVEAAAAGLPVVATDLSTIREACAPSHRGFMFPPDDDQAAEASIRSILGNAALHEKLSADAKRWARNFSIADSVRKLESVYNLYASGTKTAETSSGTSVGHSREA